MLFCMSGSGGGAALSLGRLSIMGAVAAFLVLSVAVPAHAALGLDQPRVGNMGIGLPPVVRIAKVEKRYRLNIATQPLPSALKQLHQQTGLQFVYPAEALETVTAPAVVGELTAEEALRRLLDGSGVGHRFTGEGTAALRVAQDGGGVWLEPIVVTAEKVERSYLDTFASVGIATGQDIENYHLDDVYDAFNQMANVRAFSNDRGNNSFQIRGLNADGVTEIANSAPLISVIVDGATQSAEGLRRGSRGTWDVKQIEVLRGPQSGLYGRTALAGAVVIETNDPSYTPEMAVQGTLGDQERKDGAFMLSAPIVDNQVAFRVAAEFRDQVKDITFEDPANAPLAEDQYRSVRGKLLIEPTDMPGLSALLTVSHTFDKPAANAVNGSDFFDRKFDGAASFTEFREAEVNNYIANVAYALGDGYKVRSISSHIDTDVAISSTPTSQVYGRDDLRDGADFTQDLRLEIDDKAIGLSGVVGLFYGSFTQMTDTAISYDLGFGLIPLQVGTLENETHTKAVYADLRYKVVDRWSLLLGARYQQDTVRNAQDTQSDFLGDVFFDLEADFNVFLPKYGLAYEIDETRTIAATASRGYRQGFSEVIVGTNVVNTVDPEFVWTYELAYRQTTLDKRLTFGVNLFYNEYTDQQITVVSEEFDPFTNTTNAGDSISYGAEVEARYDFGNGLTVFGAVGLLKTEFKTLDDVICDGGSCAGNEFPEAPNLTFALGGTYKHHSGVFVSASANYTGDYYSTGDINNLAAYEIENRFLVNGKVGYEQQGMTISVFADNIFDEQYLTGFSSDGYPGTPVEASIGDGRTVGVEVKAKF